MKRIREGAYHIVYSKIVFVFHVTRLQFKTNHVYNPQCGCQSSQIKQGVYIIFHDKTAVQPNS